MKKNKISRWLIIALNISDWIIYLLLVFAVILFFADLIWGLDNIAIIKNKMHTILLLSLSTFFTSSVLERKSKIDIIEPTLWQIFEKIEEKQRFPTEIQHFYKSLRRELPILQFINEARSEIFLVGTSFYHLVERHKSFFLEKSKKCDIRFLIINPQRKNKALIHGTALLFGEKESFSKELTTGYRKLIEFKQEAQQEKGKIHIKAYSNIPSINMVMIDPEKPYGRIQIEILPYKGSANMRPGFILRHTEDYTSLYHMFKTQYRNLWDDADRLA